MSVTNPDHDTTPDGPTGLVERQPSPTPWPALPLPRVAPRQGALPAPPSPAPGRSSSLAPAPSRSPVLFDATIQLAESDLHLLDRGEHALLRPPVINPLETIQLAESDLCPLAPQSSLPPLLPRAWARLDALSAERELRLLLRPRLRSRRFWAAAGAAVGFVALGWLTYLLCGTGPVPGVTFAPQRPHLTTHRVAPAIEIAPTVVTRSPDQPTATTAPRAPAADVQSDPPVLADLQPAAPPRRLSSHRRRAYRAKTADALLASARMAHRRKGHIVRKTVDPFAE